MNILITGATGFVGSHLLKHLRQQQTDRCIALARRPMQDPDSVLCNLEDLQQVTSVLKKIQPSVIYHIAGSFSNNYEIDYKSNVLCAKNLLDALVELQFPCRLVLMGSAAEYGEVATANNPISEQQILQPISIYGWTKAAQSQLASVYAQSFGVDVMVARTFNLIGEGASDKLFIGRVQKQINAVLAGAALVP